MHSAVDLVMCLGDFNEHVGRYIDELMVSAGGGCEAVVIARTRCLG